MPAPARIAAAEHRSAAPVIAGAAGDHAHGALSTCGSSRPRGRHQPATSAGLDEMDACAGHVEPDVDDVDAPASRRAVAVRAGRASAPRT